MKNGLQSNRKKLQVSTIERYSASQIWNAVLLRSESYRYECDGIYIDCGDAYRYHTSQHDYNGAVRALNSVGGIDGGGGLPSFLAHIL